MGIFNGSRKIVGISLFIFWAIVVAILIVGLLFSQKNLNNNSDPVSLLPSGSGSVVLNFQEISKHNSQSDCWTIINSKVYNITSYLGAHPGGVSAIIPYCGKDGMQAFTNLPHSSFASSLLNNYFIGNLNQTIGASQIQQNSQITPPPQRGGDNEWEDD